MKGKHYALVLSNDTFNKSEFDCCESATFKFTIVIQLTMHALKTLP